MNLAGNWRISANSLSDTLPPTMSFCRRAAEPVKHIEAQQLAMHTCALPSACSLCSTSISDRALTASTFTGNGYL